MSVNNNNINDPMKYQLRYIEAEAGKPLVKSWTPNGFIFRQPVLVHTENATILPIQGKALDAVQTALSSMDNASYEMNQLVTSASASSGSSHAAKFLSPHPPKLVDGWARYGAKRMVKTLQKEIRKLKITNQKLLSERESSIALRQRSEQVIVSLREKLAETKEEKQGLQRKTHQWVKQKQLISEEMKRVKRENQELRSAHENDMMELSRELAKAEQKLLKAESQSATKKKLQKKKKAEETQEQKRLAMVRATKDILETSAVIEKAYKNLFAESPTKIGIDDSLFLSIFFTCSCDADETMRVLMRTKNIMFIAERLLRVNGNVPLKEQLTLEGAHTFITAVALTRIDVTFIDTATQKKLMMKNGSFPALIARLLEYVRSSPPRVKDFNKLYNKHLICLRDFSKIGTSVTKHEED